MNKSVKRESRKMPTVAEQRSYLVTTVAQAKTITEAWLSGLDLVNAVSLGLPEIDDRYHVWRVPLRKAGTETKVGEAVLDAYTTEVLHNKTTRPELLESRLLGKSEDKPKKDRGTGQLYELSALRNTIGLGDAAQLIDEMPKESVDLIFTSPPYFNARPEYSEYQEYEEYLFKMRQIIQRCHRVLKDGRFFAINCSPILLRRASRSESSKRIAVPFDLHRIFVEEGYDFIDDIIWLKPEGAGWATGRGRRFAADRNPLQYKAVPVTEYVLVYRKRSDVLIDWHIRNHPNREIVEASKIKNGYEKTNVWKISPKPNSKHPAAFPLELAEKVVAYYSFKEDVVMDPFAGSGTVGAAAVAGGRRFVLYDVNPEYVSLMQREAGKWLGKAAEEILCINVPPITDVSSLF